MRNNKGQALVEFVIILPVIILIIMCIVDFGNIISNKYALENDLDMVVKLYQNNDDVNSYIESKKETIDYDKQDEYVTINLSKNIIVTTPILNNILGKNYQVKVSRTIIDE